MGPAFLPLEESQHYRVSSLPIRSVESIHIRNLSAEPPNGPQRGAVLPHRLSRHRANKPHGLIVYAALESRRAGLDIQIRTVHMLRVAKKVR